MKIWTSEHVFDHPWETVAQAAWRKYPNPMNTAVIGTDVVDRAVVNGVLHTHRLVSSKWGLPAWVLSLIGPANICYASEHSTVNPSSKCMTLKTRNLTFGKFVAVDEMVKYEPHPDDRNKTLLRQEAIVTVEGVPLSSYMEDMLTSTIRTNAGKGRQAIEWVIDKINKEVTEIRNNAVKSTDEIFNQTKKSLTTAKKSMDEFSIAAKKSLGDFQHRRNSTSGAKCPDL